MQDGGREGAEEGRPAYSAAVIALQNLYALLDCMQVCLLRHQMTAVPNLFQFLQMQSQLLILEEEKKTLDAKVAEEHEQLQAATALHKELSDQVLKVTESQEQKSKDDAIKADQRMAELQVTNSTATIIVKGRLHALDLAGRLGYVNVTRTCRVG